MPELAATSEFLSGEIESRLLMTAAQVCVITCDGDRHEYGAGTAGLEVNAGTLFRVGCITKQFTSIAIAQLVDEGVVALDDALVVWLPEVASLAGTEITLDHVLTHTAGLHVPTVPRMEFVPFDQRCQVLCGRQWRPPGWRSGVDGGYSEVLGWHVLGHLIERCSGESLSSYLRTRVLDPLGLHDTFVGMTRPEYDANLSRIGLYYDLRGTHPFPVLLDRTEDHCCTTNCAYGGFSTATDLARFYERLLLHMNGDETTDVLPARETLRQFCAPAGPERYDVTFERPCSFGLGFLSVATHQFGPTISPNAFGHMGWTGASFAFGDPDNGVAVAVITNGLLPRAAARLARARIVRSIYADVSQGQEPALEHTRLRR